MSWAARTTKSADLASSVMRSTLIDSCSASLEMNLGVRESCRGRRERNDIDYLEARHTTIEP